MSKLSYACLSSGVQYTQQSYKVSDLFPYKWIDKKWKEGFHVTAMATAGSKWAVIMSRNAGFKNQVLSIYIAIAIHSFVLSSCFLFPKIGPSNYHFHCPHYYIQI